MPIFQTLVNRGTLRPQRKVVAELGLKPAFPESQCGPCSAESASLSPLKPELLLGPLHLGLGEEEWSSVSEEGMSGSWERDQHWASQDAGQVPGDECHSGPGCQDCFGMHLRKGIILCKIISSPAEVPGEG